MCFIVYTHIQSFLILCRNKKINWIKNCKVFTFKKKKKNFIKTQEAIKIAWNTRRWYLLPLIKSDSFQQENNYFQELQWKKKYVNICEILWL